MSTASRGGTLPHWLRVVLQAVRLPSDTHPPLLAAPYRQSALPANRPPGGGMGARCARLGRGAGYRHQGDSPVTDTMRALLARHSTALRVQVPLAASAGADTLLDPPDSAPWVCHLLSALAAGQSPWAVLMEGTGRLLAGSSPPAAGSTAAPRTPGADDGARVIAGRLVAPRYRWKVRLATATPPSPVRALRPTSWATLGRVFVEAADHARFPRKSVDLLARLLWRR